MRDDTIVGFRSPGRFVHDPPSEALRMGVRKLFAQAIEPEADKAFGHFLSVLGARYPKACEYLSEDRLDLLALCDFPGRHWKHMGTTSPIGSAFGTAGPRMDKTCGCHTEKTAPGMVFQLLTSAGKKWRSLDWKKRPAEMIQGLGFVDGVQQGGCRYSMP